VSAPTRHNTATTSGLACKAGAGQTRAKKNLAGLGYVVRDAEFGIAP
jgi:hypothetical protein